MTRLLVLVRHGKPESTEEGTPDELRALTDAGRAALEGPDGLARALSLLGDSERSDMRLWSSPAVRARQTAQIISEMAGGCPVEERACLWEQDQDAFLGEARGADAACVIAVGHVPFMHKLLKRLTGDSIAFKPGAVAAVELDDGRTPGSARLAWFAQGPQVP